MGSGFARRFFVCLVCWFLASQVARGGLVTWVPNSYPTIWESEISYLVSNGDLMYLYHVHDSDSSIALYYFCLRVAQGGNSSYQYQYLAYDWVNNRWEAYKAQRSGGTRSLEHFDGEVSQVNEDKYYRWDFSGKADLGWDDETDWSTVEVRGGWSSEALQAVCMWIINNESQTESKVKIFYPEDFTDYGAVSGNPFDPQTDAGGELGNGGDGGTDPGDGGDGGTDPGDGGASGGGTVINEGDVTVNVEVDGGMSVTELVDSMRDMFFSDFSVTNSVDSIELPDADFTPDFGSHDPDYEDYSDYDYPNWERFNDVIEDIKTNLSNVGSSSAQNISIPIQFGDMEYISWDLPFASGEVLGDIVSGFRMVLKFFIFLAVAFACMRTVMRAFA